MTEDELLAEIVKHAKGTGWLVMHSRPQQGRDGKWRTALQGHVGFPDLVLCHRDRQRLIFAELKSEKGTMGPGQPEWLEALTSALAAFQPRPVHVWRPADLPEIMGTLYGRKVVG